MIEKLNWEIEIHDHKEDAYMLIILLMMSDLTQYFQAATAALIFARTVFKFIRDYKKKK